MCLNLWRDYWLEKQGWPAYMKGQALSFFIADIGLDRLQIGLWGGATRIQRFWQGGTVGRCRVLGQVQRSALPARHQDCRTAGKDNRLAYNLRNSLHKTYCNDRT